VGACLVGRAPLPVYPYNFEKSIIHWTLPIILLRTAAICGLPMGNLKNLSGTLAYTQKIMIA
jgi:hypothetical protein